MAISTLSMSENGLRRGAGKGKFLYHQLADLIRDDIERGILCPNEKLPSMDVLAREYELNKSTVRQAVAELTEEGLVESIPARGTFVRDLSLVRVGTSNRVIGWISAIDDKGLSGSYHIEMMNAARDLIQKKGGHLVVLSAMGVAPEAFVQSVQDARLDGAVLLGPAEQEPLCRLLDGAMPVVLMDSKPSGHNVNCILIDNETGGYQAVEHLLQLGHRKLGFVTGPKDWRVTRDRLAGAQAAVARLQKDAQISMIESDFSPEGGALAMKELMSRKERPTGIFFFNDEMAMGGLQVAHDMDDLAIPDDLSLIGFDDISWCAMMHPALSTIHIEKAMMGQKAIERLDEIMDRPEQMPTTLVLPTRLIVRKSTTLLQHECVYERGEKNV